MEAFFFNNPHWTWFSLGLLLIVFEMVFFSVVLIWFGGAALITGVLLLIFPGLSVATQLGIFAALSIVSLVAFKVYRNSGLASETKSSYKLNKRGTHYIGKTLKVTEEIENGSGRVEVGDTSWRAVGEDAPVGASVKVVEVIDGNLRVERV